MTPPPAATTPATAVPVPSDLAGPLTPPPVLPTQRWTGFYLGANFGGGNTSGGNGLGCTNTETGTSSGCDIIANGALSTSGVLGGGQFGYLTRVPLSWNLPPLVMGGEVDFDGSGISGSQTVAGPFSFVDVAGTCSPCSYTARQSLNSLTTLRARVGMPLDDRVLLYATGGVALGGVKVSQNLAFLGTPEGGVVSKSATLAGPVAGGGLEFALPGPWSARIEGLYYDLGNLNTTALPVNGAPTNFRLFKAFGFRGGIIRFAVNFRLGDLPY